MNNSNLFHDIKVNNADRNWCMCCCVLLLFCIIFVDYSTIPRPSATIHRFTRWLRLLTDCYAVSMCFSSHIFNSSSQGECYFYFIQCFCPFWHQESGSFLRGCEKVFAGDHFSIWQLFAFTCKENNECVKAWRPWLRRPINEPEPIPFMEVNKLRMECKKCQPRNGAMNDLPRETYRINFNKNKSDMRKYFCKFWIYAVHLVHLWKLCLVLNSTTWLLFVMHL